LNPWAHWDGVWFLRIAANGYADPHSPAFFPLYPVAVRGVGWLLGGGFELDGIVLSLVVFAMSAFSPLVDPDPVRAAVSVRVRHRVPAREAARQPDVTRCRRRV